VEIAGGVAEYFESKSSVDFDTDRLTISA
jgi:hypothetical protein